jgi:hypothetical protein
MRTLVANMTLMRMLALNKSVICQKTYKSLSILQPTELFLSFARDGKVEFVDFHTVALNSNVLKVSKTVDI